MNARVQRMVSNMIGVDIRLVYSECGFIDDNVNEITRFLQREIPSTIIDTLINQSLIEEVRIFACNGEFANASIEKREVFLYGCHDWIMLIRTDKKRLEICKFI